MIKNYLYILIFKNKKYFKIGISSNDYARIFKHDKTYKINFNESLIFEGSEESIRNIESILKRSTPDTISNIFEGNDGYTEIRDIKYLKVCLDDIEYFKKRFNIKERKISKHQINKEKNKIIKNDDSKNLIKQNIDNINNIIKSIEELDPTIKEINKNQYTFNIKINFDNEKLQNIFNKLNKPFVEINGNIIPFTSPIHSYDKLSQIYKFIIINPFTEINIKNVSDEELKSFKSFNSFIKGFYCKPLKTFIEWIQ